MKVTDINHKVERVKYVYVRDFVWVGKLAGLERL